MAQQVTLSFWVKSNVTGTYVVSLIDDDNTRDVGKTYTVNASGTWEFKTLTFPADTTGALANDNGRSLMAFFWLVAGSNFTSGTLNTSWASITNANRAVGQVNLASATNNYWQITGVQLNVGSVAAPFEFKSYQEELRECQRYYWRQTGKDAYSRYGFGSAISAGNIDVLVPNPVPMRISDAASLSFTYSAIGTTGARLVASDGFSAQANLTSLTIINTCSPAYLSVRPANTANPFTQGRPYWLESSNATDTWLAVSAEL